MPPRKKVLFVCTANSCRSQIAEAWARRLLPDPWRVFSAGLITYPITSATREAMAEVGLDLEGQSSQAIDEFDLESFDLIVTLSEEAGRYLPPLSRPERHLHRPLADPMSATGTRQEVRDAFRRARDRLRALVEQLAKDYGDAGAGGRA